ncbi:MAG: hypothetical protein JOZ15_12765 [Acidobacteria bacterium]|nr:hypothetical protein [Acidobacteriota bacterium]
MTRSRRPLPLKSRTLAAARLPRRPCMRLVLLGMALLVPAVSLPAAIPAPEVSPDLPDFSGLWEGRIVYKPAEVEFALTVEIFRDAGGALLGTVDLPSERVKFRPLRHIEVEGRHLSMEFLLDSEVRGPDAVFKLLADLAPDGKTMRGVFVESGGSRPFLLDRRGDPGSDRPPERRSPVTTLSAQAGELRAAFNRDADRVRLVLLLSPT